MARYRVISRKARKNEIKKEAIAYICTIHIVANVPSREKYLGSSFESGKKPKRGVLYIVQRPAKLP